MVSKKNTFLAFAAFLFVVLLLPTGAQASPITSCQSVSGNIVQNCGFETGNFANWSLTGNTGFASVSNNNSFSNNGNFGAALGAVSYFGFADAGKLSQNLATISGDTYTLTYWLYSQGGSPNGFEASWDGSVIAGSVLTNAGAFGYTEYQFTGLLATGSSSSLLFTEYQNPNYWGLDDVSVVASSPTSTPEPSSLLMLGAGLLGLMGFGVVRRRVSSLSAVAV